MAQRKSPSDGQTTGITPVPPPWIQRTAPYAPGRRASMLEHMARARSAPQPQAAAATARPSGIGILGDAYGHMVLFGVIALLVQSRIPLYIGVFLFLSDDARIERALGAIGIRLEPDTIGAGIIKSFAYLFGWFALLAALKDSSPAWLAAWMPADASWASIAGFAAALALVETFATLAMRRALPWFGFRIGADSLTWTAIKLVMAIGLLAVLVLLGSL